MRVLDWMWRGRYRRVKLMLFWIISIFRVGYRRVFFSRNLAPVPNYISIMFSIQNMNTQILINNLLPMVSWDRR